jgi:transposase
MGKSYLDEPTKLKIIELWGSDMKILNISKKIKKPFSTIRYFLKRYNERKSIKNLHSTGRPPKLTSPAKRRIIREVKKDRFSPVSKIKENLNFHDISRQSINNVIIQAGYPSRRPSRKPNFTNNHVKARLLWAKSHLHYTEEDWMKWCFSDEMPFPLNYLPYQRVRRARGESLLPECIIRADKHSPKLMVWGAICGHGMSDLVFIDGKMDSTLYIEVLKKACCQCMTGGVFQEMAWFSRRMGTKNTNLIRQENGRQKKVLNFSQIGQQKAQISTQLRTFGRFLKGESPNDLLETLKKPKDILQKNGST